MKVRRAFDKAGRRWPAGWSYTISGHTMDGHRTAGWGMTKEEARADFICQHTMGVGCPILAHRVRQPQRCKRWHADDCRC